MSNPGKNNLITDIAGIHVGNAHDTAAKTGSSVILCETPCVGAVAVAGGGPGTRETDLLDSDKLVERVDAVVLSGGSAYGLAAADGVAATLGAAGRGFAMVDRPDVPKTPIVPGAILYDLANGGDKSWGDSPPYRALGQAAWRTPRTEPSLSVQRVPDLAPVPGNLRAASAPLRSSLMTS